MSKSILVIDTPENCCQRRFSGSDGDYCCLGKYGFRFKHDFGRRISE